MNFDNYGIVSGQGQRKGFSTRGGGGQNCHKKGHKSKFLQQALSTGHNV